MSHTELGIEPGAQSTKLKGNTVGLAGLVAQSVGGAEPSYAAIVAAASIAVFAGARTPAILLIGVWGIAGMGYIIARLSKVVADAGGLHAIGEVAMGKTGGYITGWFYLIAEALIVPGLIVGCGYLLQTFFASALPHEHWLSNQWWIWAVVAGLVLHYLIHVGVSISVRILLAMSAIGIVAILIFDCAILFQGGAHGIAWSSFLPWRGGGPSWTLSLSAIGLCAYTFGGIEQAAYLGEEAHAPRKMIPRAVMFSVAIAGAFSILTALAIVTGYGTDKAGTQWSTLSIGVLQDLSNKYVTHGYGIFLLGIICLSGLTVTLANLNACVRLLYAWGRDRHAPAVFGNVHRDRQTPTAAIAFFAAAAAAFIGIGALWQGNTATGGFITLTLTATAGAVPLTCAYGMIGVAGFVHGRRTRGGVLLTYVAPVACVAVSGFGLTSFFYPAFPPSPFSYSVLAGFVLAFAGVAWRLIVVFRSRLKSPIAAGQCALVGVGGTAEPS
jgi:amino acid transporter